MHAAPTAQRIASSAKTAPRVMAAQGGLRIDAVLAHVARLAPDQTGARQRLLAEAEACARLVAARQRLTLALDVQQGIERLMQLAGGRERARCQYLSEREALQQHEGEARERAAQAMVEWRDAGQGFTRATHLLPTQLSHDITQAPALNPGERQALMQAYVRGGSPAQAEFDEALGRYAAAHRRCEDAIDLALTARAARLKAESDLRTGQSSLLSVANAWLAELAGVDAMLVAEARRGAVHGALRVLSGDILHQASCE